MYSPVVFGVFCIIFFIQNAVSDTESFRQKRCIVIQKQSGTHGDSAEGDGDEDYRRPQPKEPMSDRLWKPRDSTYEAEELPELQRLKKRIDRRRLKKNKYSNLY